MSAIRPAAVYYPKFGAPLAAIISQKGAAWDVDGLSTISAEFLMMSMDAWLVLDLLKVDE